MKRIYFEEAFDFSIKVHEKMTYIEIVGSRREQLVDFLFNSLGTLPMSREQIVFYVEGMVMGMVQVITPESHFNIN